MTTGEFTAEDWVERLTRALAELATAQERYRDEIAWQRQQRTHVEREILQQSAFDHPSYDLQMFYWYASRKGRDFGEHHGPLRAALAEVQRVLATHPAWAGLMDPSDDRGEIRIRILNKGGLVTLSGMIGGLMARGMEVPEDGFRVAAAELNALLGSDEDLQRAPGPGYLSVGYHVVLFYGLRVTRKVSLPGNIVIMPFEQLDAFVDEEVLQNVVPSVISHHRQKSVGALVQPFRWKPEFRNRDDDSTPALDWGGSFFKDAEDFVELLAMFHTASAICLATIPYCIHRTASYLLGQPHYHGSYQWGRSAQSFDSLTESTDLSLDALNEASEAFEGRQSANYQYCVPIIARLAEALARSGRFQTDDKILDVAIALERMYELEGGEISFKLKTRAASFLETSTDGRRRVFQDIEKFYDVRSGIVHKRKKPPSAETRADAFTRGFEVARRSVVKLLRDGPPQDWNEMVIAGIEPSPPKPQGGEGTT